MADDGFIVFTDKDWECATPEQHDWMVFNTLKSMNTRLQKLERWIWLKMVFVFLGSAVGGALMILILVTLKVKVF